MYAASAGRRLDMPVDAHQARGLHDVVAGVPTAKGSPAALFCSCTCVESTLPAPERLLHCCSLCSCLACIMACMSGSTCASLAQQTAHGVSVEHVVLVGRLCDAALPCASWSGHAGCSLFSVEWVCVARQTAANCAGAMQH